MFQKCTKRHYLGDEKKKSDAEHEGMLTRQTATAASPHSKQRVSKGVFQNPPKNQEHGTLILPFGYWILCSSSYAENFVTFTPTPRGETLSPFSSRFLNTSTWSMNISSLYYLFILDSFEFQVIDRETAPKTS